MVDVIGIAVILLGLVLLFAGAVLSMYGVALLGALVGGGIGSLGGPVLGDALGVDGTIALVAGIIGGTLIGIVIAYAILKWAIALLAFVVGAYFGAVVIAPTFADVAWYLELAIGLAIGVAVAAVAIVLTKSILIVITSLTGATLASTNVTLDTFDDAAVAGSLDPLTFDPVEPIFLALFVLGLLTQFGLFRFGHVTRLIASLPGAGVVTDRRNRERPR